MFNQNKLVSGKFKTGRSAIYIICFFILCFFSPNYLWASLQDAWQEGESISFESNPNNTSISVLTQNMYLGANIAPILEGAFQGNLAAAVKTFIQNREDTKAEERIEKLSEIIAYEKPQVIALQEVMRFSLYSDEHLIQGTEIWTEDFLEILMHGLEGKGLSYKIAAVGVNADLAIPADSTNVFHGIDRDVILVHSSIPTLDTIAEPYKHIFEVAALGQWPLKRGYVAAELNIKGMPVSVINTHLEVPLCNVCEAIQIKQAQELVQFSKQFKHPVILMGDFNAQPQSETYQWIANAGFSDVWVSAKENSYDKTCCFASSLIDQADNLKYRIDYIFAKPHIVPHTEQFTNNSYRIKRIGISEQEKTKSGLYASDHAGLLGNIIWGLQPAL